MTLIHTMYGHATEQAYLDHIAELHKVDPRTALSLSEQIDLFVLDQKRFKQTNMTELQFINSDATPKRQTLFVSPESVALIMDWYGAFHVGDRYVVKVDGKRAVTDGNGGLVVE